MQEAGRCLSCDLREFDVTVNEAACKDCGYCREVCGLEIFERSDRFNPGGYRPSIAAQAERCIGCLKCLYICPDFAITIRIVSRSNGRARRPDRSIPAARRPGGKTASTPDPRVPEGNGGGRCPDSRQECSVSSLRRPWSC